MKIETVKKATELVNKIEEMNRRIEHMGTALDSWRPDDDLTPEEQQQAREMHRRQLRERIQLFEGFRTAAYQQLEAL